MKLYSNKNECCGCGACAAVCKFSAIQMQTDEEGFRYPSIDEAKCIDCQLCQAVCPLKKEEENQKANEYYGARAEDEVRRRSSSGGMFTLLAEEILSCHGVVYGAAFNDDMHVYHMRVETYDEVDKIRRTKYVQSNIEAVFKMIESDLQSDKSVLFVGTPCQTGAIRKYLSCNKEKLYLVDIVCYGVPSPMFWEEYIDLLGKKNGCDITGYEFRDKRNKDNGHMVSWKDNTKERYYSMSEDPYSRIYFQNYPIRPSCYTCPFCTPERSSDITIGDFWGLEKVKPEFNDGMGNSLVIVHSDKGKKLWDAVKDRCQYFESGKKDALQPRLIEPTTLPSDRNLFWRDFLVHGINFVVKKYGEKNTILRRLLVRCKKVIMKISNFFKGSQKLLRSSDFYKSE